jgi:hypothetical protein
MSAKSGYEIQEIDLQMRDEDADQHHWHHQVPPFSLNPSKPKTCKLQLGGFRVFRISDSKGNTNSHVIQEFAAANSNQSTHTHTNK